MDNITRSEDEINQGDDDVLFDLLQEEGFRRVCRALEHAIGTAEASLYSELLGRHKYFKKRGQLDNEGYFFNTVLDLQHGTALTDKRQRTTIKRLEQLGFIKTKLKDSPPKRYFKINHDSNVLKGFLLQGKAVMDYLEKQKESQKQRIEEDRIRKEGYFSPKILKSAEREELKSSILADSNITKGQTNKNKVNKNKREEEAASTLLNIYLNNLTENIGSQVTVTNKQNINALNKLSNLCGDEEAAELLKLWFAKADKGTAAKGWPVGFLLNQLSEYKSKLQDYQEEQRKDAAAAERNRQLLEEELQQEEERRQEEARRAALTDEQRRLEDIAEERCRVMQLIEIRQKRIDSGDPESMQRLQEYQQRLQDLAAAEKEIINALESEAV